MILQGKNKVPVKEVILHCTAANPSIWKGKTAFQVFAEINRWHRERGFKNGFGYHALIMPDGFWYRGRPLEMVGAHTIGKNTGTLGVLLVESVKIDRIGTFRDWFTQSQEWTLKDRLGQLAWEHGIDKVSGHNAYAAKLCPGFEVVSSEWLR